MRAPALFISHGAPTVATEESEYTDALRELGRSIGRPDAILVVSAHWQAAAPRVTGSVRPKTIHDFGGFPEELYRVTYPAPGAPELAARIADILGAQVDGERGLDHGAWVPLVHLYPGAPVPVVQLSLPSRPDPAGLVALGRALAPLRDEGVLVLGSGGIVHNLARLEPGAERPADWAEAFDAWVAQRVLALDLTALMSHRDGPYAALAVPSYEHFAPLLVFLGAALPGDRIDVVYAGFQLGTLSLRSFCLSGELRG